MLHWGFFAALVILCLVFDAWVFKVARRKGYAEGARDFAPPHVPLVYSDMTECATCGFQWDTNDDLNLPPCDGGKKRRAEAIGDDTGMFE